jgi:hypothetical protein
MFVLVLGLHQTLLFLDPTFVIKIDPWLALTGDRRAAAGTIFNDEPWQISRKQISAISS